MNQKWSDQRDDERQKNRWDARTERPRQPILQGSFIHCAYLSCSRNVLWSSCESVPKSCGIGAARDSEMTPVCDLRPEHATNGHADCWCLWSACRRYRDLGKPTRVSPKSANACLMRQQFCPAMILRPSCRQLVLHGGSILGFVITWC